MTNASVVALGPGVNSAVRVQDSNTIVLTNVTASSTTTGLEINAFGGTGTVTVDRSTFIGGVEAVSNDDGYELRFGATRLDGALNIADEYHRLKETHESILNRLNQLSKKLSTMLTEEG
jgi:hypothetical protein